jgi:probable rRNA maturation factor
VIEDRIDVEVEAGWESLTDAEQLARRAGNAALAVGDSEGALTILLTSDIELAELNGRFRDKPYPTNVLSFPAPANPGGHLGDIAVAYETCVREAQEQGKTPADHLQHLVAHGVLHLVGYDHEIEADALVMEDLERRILDGIGVADPYAWGGEV